MAGKWSMCVVRNRGLFFARRETGLRSFELWGHNSIGSNLKRSLIA
jgi:hypothetical protein